MVIGYWLFVVCCGYRCLSMVINVFLLVGNTSPSVKDNLCHLYQETIAGRVFDVYWYSIAIGVFYGYQCFYGYRCFFMIFGVFDAFFLQV